jgi:hypothetical protein
VKTIVKKEEVEMKKVDIVGCLGCFGIIGAFVMIFTRQNLMFYPIDLPSNN